MNQGLMGMLKGVWWMFLMKGIIAILFGLLALLGPGIAAMSLLMAFGVYALVDGASTLWGAIKGRKADANWWLLALEGLLGVWVGWMALSRPGEITLAFLVLFALWAIFGGVLRIVTAIRLRKEIQGEWMMIAGGAISVLFGTFILTRPVAGLLSMMWAVGLFAILIGLVMVMLAMKARGFANRMMSGA